MSHQVDRLTAIQIAKIKQLGMYLDGAGLFLQVTGKSQGRSQAEGCRPRPD
jgi:hypothetical protein